MVKNQPLARSLLLLVWCVCVVTLAATYDQATALANDWPQWRGPDRTNISSERGLLKEWPQQGPPLVWQVEGIGRGITSVAVAGGKIYTVGYHYPEAPVIQTPTTRRRGFRRTVVPRGEYVIALDADSGRLLWATRVGEAVFENYLMRWLSQRTPTVDGDRLYALTAAGELICLQTQDGAELWRKNYTDDFGGLRSRWGYCDYPLVDGDRLICTPGGPEATVVALNKRTGELVWKSSLPDHRGHAYAATVVCKAGGLPHYVASTQGGLVGVSADDGTLLWSFNRNASSFNAITPIVRDNDLFCARMYRGRSVHRLDIDRSEGAFSVVEELSHQPRGDVINPFQDDMFLVGGRIYTSGRSRGLACINADSLQLVWTASELADVRLSLHTGMEGMVYADKRLYVRYNDGTMTLVELQRDGCQERGAFQIPGAQPSIGVTMPVISGGHVLLRDDERLFCYDIQQRNRPAMAPSLVQLNLSNVVDAKVAQADATFKSVFVPTPHNMVGKMLEVADVNPDARLRLQASKR